MYSITRKHFGKGGIKRISYTLVPLIFTSLKLAEQQSSSSNSSHSEVCSL